MSAQSQRALVDRWYFGVLPAAWDRAMTMLQHRLENLARVLNILHSAVEHPGPMPDDAYPCSGVVNLTTTSDVVLTGAGVTFTPRVNMKVVVTAYAPIQCSAFTAITHQAILTLYVNGVTQAGLIIATAAQVNEVSTGSQGWVISLSAGTPYTIQLHGKTTNVGTTFIVGTSTRLILVQFPNAYAP